MKLRYLLLFSLVLSVLGLNITYASLSEVEIMPVEAKKSPGLRKISRYQRPDRSLWKEGLQTEDNLPEKMIAVPERRATSRKQVLTTPPQQAIPAR